MDPETLETILRIAVPAVMIGVVAAVTSVIRGRRGRKRLFDALSARGVAVASDASALRWAASPAALAVCGEITWSAHVPEVEVGIYGGARGLLAVAASWQSTRAASPWILTNMPTVAGNVEKLGWACVGDVPCGVIARAQIFAPPGVAPPQLSPQFAFGIKEVIGTKRDFALHATEGVFHLVVLDPAELDEPVEFWIGATGGVDRVLSGLGAPS